MLNKNRVGLTLGLLLGLVHAAWSMLVALGWAQYLTDGATGLHMVRVAHEVLPFNAIGALYLIAISFIIGYINGWIFSYIYNKLGK